MNLEDLFHLHSLMMHRALEIAAGTQDSTTLVGIMAQAKTEMDAMSHEQLGRLQMATVEATQTVAHLKAREYESDK